MYDVSRRVSEDEGRRSRRARARRARSATCRCRLRPWRRRIRSPSGRRGSSKRYRDDPDTEFDLPLLIEGSALQRGVWDAMCAIPRGKTRTYGELARELGADAARDRPGCGDNRLPIVIPAIASSPPTASAASAHATGGYLLEAKRWLLDARGRGVRARALRQRRCSTRSATRSGSRTGCRRTRSRPTGRTSSSSPSFRRTELARRSSETDLFASWLRARGAPRAPRAASRA